jgi:hypothetical protein
VSLDNHGENIAHYQTSIARELLAIQRAKLGAAKKGHRTSAETRERFGEPLLASVNKQALLEK